MFAGLSKKSFLWAIAVIFLFAACASAAESGLAQDLGDGVKLECKGVFPGSSTYYISLRFVIESEKDMELKFGAAASLQDAAGNRLDKVGYFYIGDANLSEGEIKGGVPTPLAIVFYISGGNYKPTETYARTDFEINGKKIRMRNIPYTEK